jgi:hypothetical protein
MATAQKLSVSVKLNNPERSKEVPSLVVYLFNSTGKLIKAQPMGKDLAEFNVEDARYVVTVGPSFLDEKHQAPADLAKKLEAANAFSRDYIPALHKDRLEVLVPSRFWLCWFPVCIDAHGTVRKLLNPGSSSPQYATICSGVVQIFQVDLGCTLDAVISFTDNAFRDLLVERLRGISIKEGIQAQASRISQGELSLASQAAGAVRTAAATRTAALQAAGASRSSAAPAASLSELATTLSGLSGTALKNAILDNRAALSAFWCFLIPDEAFCWQELGEAVIQSDGTFSATICFWCPNDFPDLYFEVVQNFGIEHEIYDPQIACSTYYNYDGSRSVDIVVTDPTAVACGPSGGDLGFDYVEILGITDVDLQFIDGINTPFTAGSGLTNITGVGAKTHPWGGLLAMNMKFAPTMFGKYYRWSYKFDGDPDFTQITAPVVHNYQQVISFIPLIFQKIPEPLGPFNVGPSTNLFKVPDPGKDWVSIDNYYDLFFAFFDSTGGITDPIGYNPADHDGVSHRKSGMCTLMLEVFDQFGNFIPCDNPVGVRTEGDHLGDPPPPGSFTFLMPHLNTFSPAPLGNITDHGRLIFRILVDNNNTIAKLPGVSDPSGTADACGFLNFGSLADNVEIDYVARHPNNFLTWGLSVVRGLGCGVASTSGSSNSPAGPPPPPAAFNNTAGFLLRDVGGICVACDNGGAFAVNLDCGATATNGRFLQSQYDSQATIAFALLKPCPPPPK